MAVLRHCKSLALLERYVATIAVCQWLRILRCYLDKFLDNRLPYALICQMIRADAKLVRQTIWAMATQQAEHHYRILIRQLRLE